MKLEKYVEDPNRMKAIKKMLYSLLILLVLFDISVHLHLFPGHAAGHFFGDKIWGFWSIFGFVCSVLLIKICKGIGYLFIMKKENYYD